MEFVDGLECVIGGHVMEIKYRHKTCQFLFLAPESMSLVSVRRSTPAVESKFEMSKEMEEKGLFLKCCWIHSNLLAVITTLGKIILFEVRENSITPSLIISSKYGEYTAIAEYKKRFILVGDINGNLILLSLSGLLLQRKKISDSAIKQIEASKRKIAVLVSDGSLVFGDISNAIILHQDIGPFSEFTGKNWTRIASDWRSGLFALCEVNNNILITDFGEYERKFECDDVSNLSFDLDEQCLFVICRQEIRIWSVLRETSCVYSRPDCAFSNAVAVANQHLLVCCEQGVLVYSILKQANSILYNSSRFMDWRILQDRAIPFVYDFPENVEANYIASDCRGNFVSIASNSVIRLFSQKLMKLLPIRFEIPEIQGMCWCRNFLFVISRDVKKAKYFVECLEIGQKGLTRTKRILLPNKPVCLGTDLFRSVAIATKQSVFSINSSLVTNEFPIPFVLTDVYPYVKQRKIFGLTEDRQLIEVTSGQTGPVVIMSGVTNFHVCLEQSLLFCSRGKEIFMSRIGDSFSFVSIIQTEMPVIGIEPAKWSLLLYNDKELTFMTYLDCLIVIRLDNQENTMKLLDKSGEKKTPFLTHLLLRSIEYKRASACIGLLKTFPLELQREIMVNALRRLESCDRRELGDWIESPLHLFCELSGTETEQGYDIVTFRSKSSIKDIKLAAALLPVLLEEYGPSVAFPAAFFCLSVDHESSESVGAYARFLEPLLVKAIATSAETVSCVGMEMGVGLYAELRQSLEEAVCACMGDLFIRLFQPQDALELSALMRVPMSAFLTRPKYCQLKNSFSKDELVSRFTCLIDHENILPYQISLLIRDFEASNWTEWATALKACTTSLA